MSVGACEALFVPLLHALDRARVCFRDPFLIFSYFALVCIEESINQATNR